MAQYEYVPCHVVDARYLGDYKVWLEFNDGRKGVVDLADELYGECGIAIVSPSFSWTTASRRSRGPTASTSRRIICTSG